MIKKEIMNIWNRFSDFKGFNDAFELMDKRSKGNQLPSSIVNDNLEQAYSLIDVVATKLSRVLRYVALVPYTCTLTGEKLASEEESDIMTFIEKILELERMIDSKYIEADELFLLIFDIDVANHCYRPGWRINNNDYILQKIEKFESSEEDVLGTFCKSILMFDSIYTDIEERDAND